MEPGSELSERLGREVGVLALFSLVATASRELALVVVPPYILEVSVDVHVVLIIDSKVVQPPREALSSAVSVERGPFHPLMF